MYQNQFQKYDPQPFVELDIEPTVVSEDGPIMDAAVCRAALQRSVAKIFYHAGFEDTQPSALEAATDVASHVFMSIVQKFSDIVSIDKVAMSPEDTSLAPRFNFEERILHVLNESGNDLETLEAYGKEDMDRLFSKLKVVHERTKLHLAELLVCFINPSPVLSNLSNLFYSDLHSIQTPLAQTVLVHSTKVASSSSKVTLQKRLVKISSASRTLVSSMSWAWMFSVCRFTCCTTRSTKTPRFKIHSMSRLR